MYSIINPNKEQLPCDITMNDLGLFHPWHSLSSSMQASNPRLLWFNDVVSSHTNRKKERKKERVPEEVSSSKLRTKIQMVIPNAITTHKVQYTFNPTFFTLMLLHLYSSSSTYIRRLGIGEFRQCKSYIWRWRRKAQIWYQGR